MWIITSNLWEVMTWNFEVTGFLKYYFWSRGSATMAHGPKQLRMIYVYNPFCIFKVWRGKISKTNIACHVKWYEIQVSLSIKLYSEHKKSIMICVIQVSLSINKSLLEHEKDLFFYLYFLFNVIIIDQAISNKHFSIVIWTIPVSVHQQIWCLVRTYFLLPIDVLLLSRPSHGGWTGVLQSLFNNATTPIHEGFTSRLSIFEGPTSPIPSHWWSHEGRIQQW